MILCDSEVQPQGKVGKQTVDFFLWEKEGCVTWGCRAVSKTEAEEVAIEPLLTLKEAEPEQTTGRDWGAANLKASGTGSQESAKTSVASPSYPGQMRAN